MNFCAGPASFLRRCWRFCTTAFCRCALRRAMGRPPLFRCVYWFQALLLVSSLVCLLADGSCVLRAAFVRAAHARAAHFRLLLRAGECLAACCLGCLPITLIEVRIWVSARLHFGARVPAAPAALLVLQPVPLVRTATTHVSQPRAAHPAVDLPLFRLGASLCLCREWLAWAIVGLATLPCAAFSMFLAAGVIKDYHK